MLNTKGLSLAHAPPIAVPLRFFLAAPPFALAAGGLIVVDGEALLQSRWAPTSLAVVHLLVLGFLSMIMCGALLQLLPVLLGADRSTTTPQGSGIAIGLGGGTALLASGLLFATPVTLLPGAVLVAGSLLSFIALAGWSLLTTTGSARSRNTVSVALSAFCITVMLGLMLTANRLGWLSLQAHQAWVDTHLAWGLLGWIGLLLTGIAAELLPMFYLTPAYPRWLKRGLPVIVMLLLTLSLRPFLDGGLPAFTAIQTVLMVLIACFALVSFILQRRRRRPRRDGTLGFWWLGQSALLLAVISWLAGGGDSVTGVLGIGGLMSLVCGMLYKIVPFLCWYHLQTRKVMRSRSDIRLPTMQQFIPQRAARWQLATHAAALLLLALAAWMGMPTVRLGGAMLMISALFLWMSLLMAYRLYRSTRRTL